MSPMSQPSKARVSGIHRAAAASPALQPTAEPDAVTAVRNEPAGAVPPAAPRERARPTRITVDLAGELYGFLRGYAQDRHVAAADVLRELIRQLRDDPDLSVRVTAEAERRREALAEAMRAAKE